VCRVNQLDAVTLLGGTAVWTHTKDMVRRAALDATMVTERCRFLATDLYVDQDKGMAFRVDSTHGTAPAALAIAVGTVTYAPEWGAMISVDSRVLNRYHRRREDAGLSRLFRFGEDSEALMVSQLVTLLRERARWAYLLG